MLSKLNKINRKHKKRLNKKKKMMMTKMDFYFFLFPFHLPHLGIEQKLGHHRDRLSLDR